MASRSQPFAEAPGMALPDISRLRIVRRVHWGRWLAAGIILALLALIGRAFAKARSNGPMCFASSPCRRSSSGIVNTVVMSVLAMALGIVLGVLVAIMRMSPNPVLRGVALGYTWLFRGTPVILQLLLWFNLALVFPVIGVPGLLDGAHRRCDDAVPRRAPRARHQPGRLYVGGDAGGHDLGRHRTV